MTIRAEVNENSPANTFVEVLRIINKPPGTLPNLRCNIASGNEASHFVVSINGEQDCELRTTAVPVDFEEAERFSMEIEFTVNVGSVVQRGGDLDKA